MIELKDIYGLFRMIVAGYPYDRCERLNTFAVFDERADLNTENLGKSYADYLSGTFWSRNWYLSGADPNSLRKEYGLLAVEHKVSEIPDASSAEMRHFLYVNVFQQTDCETCPGDCQTAAEEVDASNFRILRRVIRELLSAGQYRITPAGESPYTAWMPEGQADALSATGAGVSFLRPFYAFLDQSAPVKVYKTAFGVDMVRSAAFELTVTTCSEDDLSFDYSTPEVDRLGVVKCDNC